MMPIRITVTMDRPHDISARAWNRDIMPKAWEAMGEHWVKTMLPLHFQTIAARRYGYAKRSEKYTRNKLRRGHGDAPLVYTGRLRELVKHTAQVKGYPSRCTVKFALPAYAPARRNTFTGRDRKGKQRVASRQPDKVKEITTILDYERKELIQVLDAAIQAGLARVRATPKTILIN